MSVPINNDIETREFLRVENNIERKKETLNFCLTKVVGVIVLTMLSVPFIICNFYYGLSTKYENCSTIQPNGLITMRMYLVVSAFVMSLVYIGATIYILAGKMFDNNGDFRKEFQEEIYGLYGCLYLMCITVWNIIGAVVFFGHIYPDYNCSKSFSIYVSFCLSLSLLTSFNSVREAIKYRMTNR